MELAERSLGYELANNTLHKFTIRPKPQNKI